MGQDTLSLPITKREAPRFLPISQQITPSTPCTISPDDTVSFLSSQDTTLYCTLSCQFLFQLYCGTLSRAAARTTSAFCIGGFLLSFSALEEVVYDM
jgi:hypothetical protein